MQLDPAIAENYQQLVDAGARTWADIAAAADEQRSPDLAEYARAQAGQKPREAKGQATGTTTEAPPQDGR